jgi:hypothetical protein
VVEVGRGEGGVVREAGSDNEPAAVLRVQPSNEPLKGTNRASVSRMGTPTLGFDTVMLTYRVLLGASAPLAGVACALGVTSATSTVMVPLLVNLPALLQQTGDRSRVARGTRKGGDARWSREGGTSTKRGQH